MSFIPPLRIGVTGSKSPEQDCGLDINDFWLANGNASPVFATDPATGLLILGSCDFVKQNGIVAARVDFEFDLPNAIAFDISDPVPLGLHVNPLVTQQVDGAEDELKAQLLDWFGYTSNGFPACPGVVDYVNPAQDGYAGGQAWKRTPRGSVLIYPDPIRWRRR